MKKPLTFTSELCSNEINVGDIVELRDFTPFIPEGALANEDDADKKEKWELREYLLIDGTPCKMLLCDYRLDHKTEDLLHYDDKGTPPVIEIKVPFNGRYAIWAGMLYDGTIDLALDDEDFIGVFPVHGARYGRGFADPKREYRMFWRNAELKDSVIRIRVKHGTYSVADLGRVFSSIASLQFVRLPDDAPLAPIDNNADKEFIVIVDGFSHYFGWGKPGECIDNRLVRAYKGSDVKTFFTQIMGPLNWKSDVNSYLGEGMTEESFVGKRSGDRRVVKYIEDTIKNGNEAIRKMTEECHKYGMENHLSIRANLYWKGDSKYMKGNNDWNGRFWNEHHETCCLPGSAQLDFGKKEVQDYHLALYRDTLEKFDIDGINLDLTRWPRCLRAELHGPEILVNLCKGMKEIAREFEAKRGHRIRVSLTMVEYFHSGTTLEAQAIDFEALCASGALDFICLQALDHEKYVEIAHKYGVQLHGVLEDYTPYHKLEKDDPLWACPDGTTFDDPCAGDEFADDDKPKYSYVGSGVAPFERYRQMDKYYSQGLDGTAVSNNFAGTLYFRDCGHSDAVAKHVEDFTVFGQIPGEYIFFLQKAK
ncbi:MAG: hypothetical protein IJY93_00950 [Clostridia bacterium]|nr:hypothetical protein [Clostridia bacterium]